MKKNFLIIMLVFFVFSCTPDTPKDQFEDKLDDIQSEMENTVDDMEDKMEELENTVSESAEDQLDELDSKIEELEEQLGDAKAVDKIKLKKLIRDLKLKKEKLLEVLKED